MKNRRTLSDYLALHYKERGKLKILHYNAVDTMLKKELHVRGFTNFLGILTTEETEGKSTKLFIETDTNVVYKNNATVIILENASVEHVKKSLKSAAEKIIIKSGTGAVLIAAVILSAAKTLRGKRWDVHTNSFVDGSGKVYRTLILTRLHEKELEARRYLSPEMGLNNFFRALNDRGIRYVILRWFENIPFMDINEDIDLLVSDKDVEQVQNLLDEKIGILPFDIYSVSGMTGSSFRYISYYPPHLSEKIIDNREVWEGKYNVPSRLHYLLSLVYHVVYHKGAKSGIGFNGEEQEDRFLADHDYPAILSALAQENNIHLKEMNLNYLHKFLETVGWAPANETIRKLNTQVDVWLESLADSKMVTFN